MKKCTLFMRQTVVTRLTQPMSTVAKQTTTEYCLELVRKNDYENFLCALLLPANIRSAAFAIRAFNVQVALVEDQVQNNIIGAMRLKFWEDTLSKIYDGVPPRNPVALELHRILSKHQLSKHFFKRLIKARAEKLSTSIFTDIEDIEKYSENTVSSIYYLLLEANGTKSIERDHVASHLGKAHGIVTLIRSVPYNARKRIIVLPQDILMKHSVSTETVFRGQYGKELCDTIFEVSSRAKQHLDKAHRLRTSMKDNANMIFLPAIVVDMYLEKLRKVDFDVFHPSLQKRNSLLPLQLYWKKLLF